MRVGNNSRSARKSNQKQVEWQPIKSQLTLTHGVDEGGVVVDEDDDEWEPIKLLTCPCDSNSGYWRILSLNSVKVGQQKKMRWSTWTHSQSRLRFIPPSRPFMGAQTKHPETKRPETKRPETKRPETKCPWTKRPWGQNIRGDKTSVETKRLSDKTSVGQNIHRPWGQNVCGDKTSLDKTSVWVIFTRALLGKFFFTEKSIEHAGKICPYTHSLFSFCFWGSLYLSKQFTSLIGHY